MWSEIAGLVFFAIALAASLDGGYEMLRLYRAAREARLWLKRIVRSHNADA